MKKKEVLVLEELLGSNKKIASEIREKLEKNCGQHREIEKKDIFIKNIMKKPKRI